MYCIVCWNQCVKQPPTRRIFTSGYDSLENFLNEKYDYNNMHVNKKYSVTILMSKHKFAAVKVLQSSKSRNHCRSSVCI